MAERIHTDMEALYGIREAIVKFNENIQISQGDFSSCFEEMDYQISGYYSRLQESEDELMSQINQACNEYENEKIASERNREGRTDSFWCRKCDGRMILKIIGDKTQCREANCDGIAVRVYNNSEYQQHMLKMEQIKEKIEEMQRQVRKVNEERSEIEQIKNRYDLEKERILGLLSTDSDVSADSVICFIDKSISNVGDYHSIDFDISDGEDFKKKMR